MSRTTSELSVAELEKLLSGKKSQLEILLRRRAHLAAELSDIEQKISSVEGRRSNGSVPARRAGAGKRRRMLRPKNDRSLKEVVVELLTENRKGLGLDELSKKVLETGYKTSSTNFKNTLYQCLYNAENIALDKKNGLYHLV
jgi:hypothetical protein